MEFKDYYRILLRHWPISVGITVSTMILFAFGYLYTRPPVSYRADASLYLPEKKFIWTDRVALGTEIYNKATHQELIVSKEVIERALRDPELSGLYDNLDEEKGLDQARRRLKGSLSTSLSETTGKLTVTSTQNDKNGALESVNAVARAYIDFSKDRRSQSVKQAIDFIDRQIVSIECQIAAKKGKLQELPPQHDLPPASLEEEALHEQIRVIRNKIIDNEKLAASVRGDIAFLSETAHAREPWGSLAPVPSEASGLWKRITSLEADRETLLLRATPNHPEVVALGDRIRTLRDRHTDALQRDQEKAHTQNLLRVIEEIRKRKADLRNIEQQQKELDGRFRETWIAYENHIQREISPEEQKLLREREKREGLQASIQGLKDRINTLETSRDDLRISGQLISNPVEIADLAKTALPLVPPARDKIMIGLVFSLILGLSSAFLVENLRSTLRTERDVRRYLNTPVLGTVPLIRKQEDLRFLQHVLPDAPFAEHFHSISALIDGQPEEEKARTIMISSADPEEGKSTVISNLAASLGRCGASTVVVDADLRKGVLHEFFSCDRSFGLTHWLQNGGADPVDNLCRPTAIENVWVVPIGEMTNDPIAMLRSEVMDALLAILKERFEYVLIDAPPAGPVADCLLLAPRVDGVILLAASEKTSRDRAAYAKRLIESARGRILGTILNRISVRSSGYDYYYYYSGRSYRTRRSRSTEELS